VIVCCSPHFELTSTIASSCLASLSLIRLSTIETGMSSKRISIPIVNSLIEIDRLSQLLARSKNDGLFVVMFFCHFFIICQ
jgi:hypothetical protein